MSPVGRKGIFSQNMRVATIQVPNVLKAGCSGVEQFYACVETALPADCYALDMRAVDFVRPYGVIALTTAARRLSLRSGRPVLLGGVCREVSAYLHRMDLFELEAEWLQLATPIDETWLRSDQTENLLELTAIKDAQSVAAVMTRAKRIFSRWLALSELGNLLSVLGELCANIYQHSQDPYGCVLIQKYELAAGKRVIVNLAVGDIGCGIRGSLSARHGSIGATPLDYLKAAMSGTTARGTGRGGLGLRTVEQIAASRGGYLWLRSETAAIFSKGSGNTREHTDLVHIPGTQVAVQLHAPASPQTL